MPVRPASAWVENGTGRLVRATYGPASGVLRLADGGEVRRYHLTGTGGGVFRLTRLDANGDRDEPAGYHLRLAQSPGGYDECECKAAARWGRCVHLAAVRWAANLGFLSGRPSAGEPARQTHRGVA